MVLRTQPLPTIQIQVVAYNSGTKLAECLRAIGVQTYPVTRVLVIDNNSADNCVERAKQAGYSFDVISLKDNVGYSRGHNIGFAEAFERNICYVLTVNPDVLMFPNYVEGLVSACNENPQHGGATGKLLRPTPDVASRAVIDSAGLQMGKFYHVRDRGTNKPDQGHFENPDDVWGICGAAALYRCKMLRDVALQLQVFDESFFVYKEDVDLCWRANRLGWKFLYTPTAKAIHERGWKRHTKVPTHAVVHSFVNQIALVINHVPTFSLYTWLTFMVEFARYLTLCATQPTVAIRIFRLLKHNWTSMWEKRMVLRQQSKTWEQVPL